jgi:hypothetical protein
LRISLRIEYERSFQRKVINKTRIYVFNINVNTDCDLVGCCTVYRFDCMPMFRLGIMSPSSEQMSSSDLKMTTIYDRNRFNLVTEIIEALYQNCC